MDVELSLSEIHSGEQRREQHTPKPGDRVSMSSFRIEGLGDLEVHDENLRYRGHVIGFDAIRSVRFTATQIQHSVNFIPTGSTFTSELYLILETGKLIQIRQERAFRGKTQKQKMQAVWQAAEIISIATFNRRILRYERNLSKKGFFQVGQYQITKDGGLFLNRERLLGLHDVDVKLSLGPFQLYIQRARHGFGRLLGAQQHVIEIDTDRDCILYILKHFLGISLQGSHVREKTVDRRQVFFSAILRLGAKLAKVDGRISREEIRAFKQVFKIDETTVPDATHIFQKAVGSPQKIEDIAGHLRVLGLGSGASVDEIKIAYRRLAREHHPDALRAKGVPIDGMRQSEEALKKINEAYAYLARNC